MPARRRPPPQPAKPAAPPKARPSKLARENNISAAEESEIKEAFELFAEDSEADQVIPIEDVRRALIALNLPPTDKQEMREILDSLDPTDTGTVSYTPFLSVCALKIHARTNEAADEDDEEDNSRRNAQREEIEAAFRLFLGSGARAAGRGGNIITLAHLKRVTRELKEDEKISEDALTDMIAEANGGAGAGKGVSMEDFEGVMRRAGLFR